MSDKDITDAIMAARSLVSTLVAAGIDPNIVASSMALGVTYAYEISGLTVDEQCSLMKSFAEKYQAQKAKE